MMPIRRIKHDQGHFKYNIAEISYHSCAAKNQTSADSALAGMLYS